MNDYDNDLYGGDFDMYPAYLREPVCTGRVYGTLSYNRRSKCWTIKGEPCVTELAKRLFPGCDGHGRGVARFTAHRRVVGDLNWLMLRYPLEIKETDRGRWEEALEDAREYALQRQRQFAAPQFATPPQGSFDGELMPFQQQDCSFRTNIEQTEINKMVAKIISAMVNNPLFAAAIKDKIGTAVDTNDMERQISVLQAQLKQVLGTKTRLEHQMDTLDVNDVYYDRKILDLQRRYDEQYEMIGEIEDQLSEIQNQIRSIQQEKISGDNIYRLLLAFDEVYNSATEVEQKEFMKAFIERIELFPEKRNDGCWIKNIVFNFPVPTDNGEAKEIPLESQVTVETKTILPLTAPFGKAILF